MLIRHTQRMKSAMNKIMIPMVVSLQPMLREAPSNRKLPEINTECIRYVYIAIVSTTIFFVILLRIQCKLKLIKTILNRNRIFTVVCFKMYQNIKFWSFANMGKVMYRHFEPLQKPWRDSSG